MAERLSPVQLNYLRSLSDEDHWVSVWGGVVIRDYERSSGYLTRYRTIQDFDKRPNTEDFWIHLKLRVFRETSGEEYPIFSCPKCPEMAAVPSLTIHQSRSHVEALRCTQSVLSQYLYAERWRQHWPVPNIGIQREGYKNCYKSSG